MTHRPTRLRAAVSALLAIAIVSACSASSATPASTARIGPTIAASSAPPPPGACPTKAPPPLPAGQTRTVTIDTTQGQIVVKVDGALGPNAAGNFVALAQCGYYVGVVFHRLVPGFVIQGGDGQFGRAPTIDVTRVGSGGPGYTIKDELVKGTYKRGIVAMARSPLPDSQGSQFFIVLSDGAGPTLESARTYAIFGAVASGMDTVDKIAAMPNSGDRSGNAAIDPVPMVKLTMTSP